MWKVRERILNGDITLKELVELFLKRIEERKEVNAFIKVLKNYAVNKAKELDLKLKKGKRLGRLFGGIIAVKDNICFSLCETTCGSKILYNFIPPYNATVIDRVLKEDGIVIGKTNMDEFAMGSSTELSYFGATKNPLNLSLVVGGSSGGSAAAIADGQANLALGSDTGGSIRCPAAFCGVVGLKPTYGRVSRYGLVSYANSLEQIGPITRDVRDCATLLSVIAGKDEYDATSAPIPVPKYEKRLNGNFKDLRIGIVKELVGEGVESVVRREFYSYVSKIENLGFEVNEISLPSLNYALPSYYIIAMSEASSNLARFDGLRYGYNTNNLVRDWHTLFSKNRGEGFGFEVKRRIILGTFALSAGYFDQYYLKAQRIRTLIRMDFERAFKKFSFLISPTMPLLPYKLGEKIKDPLALYASDLDTVSANLAGIPAISIPCGYYMGLPIGFQIMAKPFKEDILLSFSNYLMEAI
jgi:aspartyl-tRNA(Asn)/glutamyl-tRNA(Gln) amidotransferase subunit A